MQLSDDGSFDRSTPKTNKRNRCVHGSNNGREVALGIALKLAMKLNP